MNIKRGNNCKDFVVVQMWPYAHLFCFPQYIVKQRKKYVSMDFSFYLDVWENTSSINDKTATSILGSLLRTLIQVHAADFLPPL